MSGANLEPIPGPIPLPGGEPAPGGQQNAREPARQAEPQFEMVETDAFGQPINRPPQQQVEPGQELRQDEGAEPREPEPGEPQGQPRRFKERDNRARRQGQREARDNTFRELQFLRGEMSRLTERLDHYEPRFAEYDEGRVHQQISELDRQIGEAKRLGAEARRTMSNAMTSGDTEAFTAALDARDQAIASETRLAAQRERLAPGEGGRPRLPHSAPVQPQFQNPQAPQPVVISQAGRELMSDFQAENDWIRTQPGPNGQAVPLDLDSEMMLRIDNYVANQGYNPNTQDYWDEVRALGAQYLPHKFGGDPQPAPRQNGGGQPRQQQREPAPQRRGPPVAGSPSPTPPPSNGNTVYISPERKEALIASGIIGRDGSINDQRKLQRTLKGYAEWDRANPGVAARQ